MEFVTCPHCGQIQAKTEDGICIKCKKDMPQIGRTGVAPETEDGSYLEFHCPNCKHIQIEEKETCEKCGAPMRKKGSIRFMTVFCFAMFLFFFFQSCKKIQVLYDNYPVTSQMEIFAIVFSIIWAFFLLVAFLSFRSDRRRPGNFIVTAHYDEKEVARKRETHLSLDGILPDGPGLERVYIFLDEKAQELVLETQSKKNILPVRQITSMCTVKLPRKEDKSVLGRSVAGAIIAGPTGAIVGAISGSGQRTVYDDYLRITYYSKNASMEERNIFLRVNVSSESYQGFYRRLAGMLPSSSSQKGKRYL